MMQGRNGAPRMDVYKSIIYLYLINLHECFQFNFDLNVILNYNDNNSPNLYIKLSQMKVIAI